MAKLGFAIIWASLLAVARPASAQGLSPDCPIPFASIAKHRSIDDNCAARGEVPDPPVEANDPAHALQNLAKNNFCATGSPELVTFKSFEILQEKLDRRVPQAKTWDRNDLPADRSVLLRVHKTTEGATIGEGTLVTFAAWLMKTPPQGRESCNCGTKNRAAKEMVDIHMVLVPSPDEENTSECESVTAEISPHFRPDRWNAAILQSAKKHPLRVIGRLMYDAAHRPCSGNPLRGAPPRRISGWEVHPVYAIDVCKNKSLNGCKADDDSVWTSLDQWGEEERARAVGQNAN